MPRFSSVGEYTHCDIEEMYIILKAKGTMAIEGEKIRVSAECIILTKKLEPMD
jgi:mannose-6-phosphate isomerase-like protein (cupin superfamily)